MTLSTFASAADIEYVARFFTERMRREAERISNDHPRPDGKNPWTRAVWHCFDALRSELGPTWSLYPRELGEGSGRTKGEYLVDFMLMDRSIGPRIACESELGKIRDIDWAFDKLRGVKADVKVLLFEFDFTDDSKLPPTVGDIVTGYLSKHGHFLPDEHFLLIQLTGDKARSFVWSPAQRGPYHANEIKFRMLTGSS